MPQTGEVVLFAPRRLPDLAGAAERALAVLGWPSYGRCSIFRGSHILGELPLGLSCAEVLRHLGWMRMALMMHGPEGLVQQRVAAAVEGIPVEIRDRFVPVKASVHLGPESIYQVEDDVVLLGRTRLSVRFYGYGTPLNWIECRRLILEHPEILAVKALFEEQIGPLQLAVTWSG
ncbi:MAG: hypothetical protein IT204_11190 [Fimbriimonadaceae bacterium]|nr:hypothetical protein [Fimbriimonadaceae bacterium]